MNRSGKTLLWITVTALAFGLGYILAPRGAGQRAGDGGAEAAPAEAAEEYTCSMHPQIRQPKPGLCPICAMELIPVTTTPSEQSGPRELHLTENAIALAEIQTTPAERKFVQRDIALAGKITYDETRVANITTWVPGRLDRMFVNYTGIQVNTGDHLVYLYSQELYVMQAEYLIQRRAGSTAADGRNRLLLAGMTEQQVNELERTGKPQLYITIYSPASGTVVEKHGLEGQYVETGTKLYTIADLSRVWLMMDAYETDMPWIRYGQTVEFTTEAWPGTVFTGVVAFVSPLLTERTRTVNVRVNVENPNGKLKPGFFADAVIHATIAGEGMVIEPSLAGRWISPMHPEVIKDGPGTCDVCGIDLVPIESMGYALIDETNAVPPLVIPATAPLITGRRAIVYLADQERPGVFTGREIRLGPRAGEYYIVAEGLREGERVVTRGNFKIDSALQISAKPSMMSMEDSGHQEEPAVIDFNNQTCPVMGGDVSGTDSVEYQGIRYGLCCPGCDETFLADPEHYLAKLPNNGQIVDLDNQTCPVMGGDVNAELSIVYNGYRIYFCCPGCEETFLANPEHYLSDMVSEKQQAPAKTTNGVQ